MWRHFLQVSAQIHKLDKQKTHANLENVIANASRKKQPHILAHLLAPFHGRPLRNQKS